MNYYYFNYGIEPETVNNLIDKLSSIEGKINLYFSTNGGNSPSMGFLIKYFNSISDRLIITLTGYVCSAGTQILTDYKGKIKIDLFEMDYFLFHAADRESLNIRKGKSDKILNKQDLEWNKNFAKKLKKKELLTDKQIKDYLKGKDIIIYKDQYKKWKL
jgi:hypothetical protein